MGVERSMSKEFRERLNDLMNQYGPERFFGEACLAVAACYLHVLKMPKHVLFATISETWSDLSKTTKPVPFMDPFDTIVHEAARSGKNTERVKTSVTQKILGLFEESNETLVEKACQLTSLSLSVLYVNGAKKDSVLQALNKHFQVLSSREIMENLSPQDLFSLKRFAPVGHPWFVSGSPEHFKFANLYAEKVSRMGEGFETNLSKQTGFVPTNDISNLIRETLTPYKGEFLADKEKSYNRGDR